jgi:hypothetical protein
VDKIDYKKLDFKIPVESSDYLDCSDFVVMQIESIINDAMDLGKNKINTNLKLGLPMENINKIAGPFVEAWAFEIFNDILEDLMSRKISGGFIEKSISTHGLNNVVERSQMFQFR